MERSCPRLSSKGWLFPLWDLSKPECGNLRLWPLPLLGGWKRKRKLPLIWRHLHLWVWIIDASLNPSSQPSPRYWTSTSTWILVCVFQEEHIVDQEISPVHYDLPLPHCSAPTHVSEIQIPCLLLCEAFKNSLVDPASGFSFWVSAPPLELLHCRTYHSQFGWPPKVCASGGWGSCEMHLFICRD